VSLISKFPFVLFSPPHCTHIYESNFCRFPKRDETTATSDINLTTDDLSPLPAENDSNDTKVNGSGNLNAFSTNQSILAHDAPDLSQATDLSPNSVLNSSQLFDSHTTTSDAPLTTSPKQGPQSDSAVGLDASDLAIDLAVEDSAPISSVPQAVEAPESDLRTTNSTSASTHSSEPTAESESLHLAPTDSVAETAPEQLNAKINHESLSTTRSDMSANSNHPNEPASSTHPASLPRVSTTQKDAKQGAEDPNPSPMQIDSEPALGSGNDATMSDAPTTKVAREREDDDVVEPSAKRPKMEDPAMDTLAVKSSALNVNGDALSPLSSVPISEYQGKEIIKILKNVAKSGYGKNFRQPVIVLWPQFADSYTSRIATPMDLNTMQKKIIEKVYRNIDELKADAQLLHSNAVTFNGAEHAITKAGAQTRDAILEKIDTLPAEPVPQAKKDKKVKRPAQPAAAVARAPAAAPRRQSKGAQASPAPAISAPGEIYALKPDGTPQPRRDSTKTDGGRPKREIHPPKPKDLPYTSRPKTKKFATELKFCEEVLNELQKPKHFVFSGVFQAPVDPVALSIPNYYAIIKKPMDLSTISKKLDGGSYTHAHEFEKDVRLMLNNCFKFNPAGNPVNAMGQQMQELFEKEWSKKDHWMAEHAPPVASPPSALDSEDEEEEEEEVPDAQDSSTLSAAKERLLEEQQKLITLMTAKPANQGMIQMQQDMVDIVMKRVKAEEENAKKKVTKKPKAPKPSKKIAPVKKPGPQPKKAGKAQRYMGTLEKETISNGLSALPDHHTANVLEWIQNDQGTLAVSIYLNCTFSSLTSS
jgi:bromodomain-containing factor 1